MAAKGMKAKGTKSPFATNTYGKITPPGSVSKNSVNSTKKTGNDLRVKSGK